MAVSAWSSIADNNTSLEGVNVAEGWAAANANNAIRAVAAAIKARFVEGAATPEDFGAVGNGTTNDTIALVAAFASPGPLFLPAGKTYLYNSDLTITQSGKQVSGPGVLRPVGSASVTVTGGASKVRLSLTFNAPSHTGWAIRVENANRVFLDGIVADDAFGLLRVQQANAVYLSQTWGQLRGPGILWYGTNALRSDLLMIQDVIYQCADTEYGLDWDGNCHSLIASNLGIIRGRGCIVRNTSGGSTFPAIGRFVNFQQDYPQGVGFDIVVGVDLDFTAPYVLGGTQSGFRIANTVNTGEVRIAGGKSRGNARYGIENLSNGPVRVAGIEDFEANALGPTFGNVWNTVPRQQFGTGDFYATVDSGGNPLLAFAPNYTLGFNRSANTLFYSAGGATSHQWTPQGNLLLGGGSDYAGFSRGTYYPPGTAPTSAPSPGGVIVYRAGVGFVAKLENGVERVFAAV
jgi:hypothetical protein